MRLGRPQVGKGRPFGAPGHDPKAALAARARKRGGRTKGAVDTATNVKRLVSDALIARAFDRVAELVDDRNTKVSLEACRTILAYGLGLPKATLEIQGGASEFARELATALQEARSRRALASASPTAAGPVAPGVVAVPPVLAALPAGFIEAELVTATAQNEEPTE